MKRLVSYLVVLYLILTVFKIELYGATIEPFLLLVISCLSIFVIAYDRLKLKRPFLLYIIYTYIVVLSFSIYGLNMEGEEHVVLKFLKPFSFFIIIPSFYIYYERFGAQSFERMMSRVLFALVLYFLILSIMAVVSPSFLRGFELVNSQLAIAWYIDFPRVMLKTIAFFLPLFCLLLFGGVSGFRRFFLLLLLVFASVVSRNFILILGIGTIYLIYLLINKKYIFLVLIFCSSLVLIGYSTLFSPWQTLVEPSKARSVSIKVEQLNNFDRGIENNLFLGKGVGYVFESMDARGAKSEHLEVVPVEFFQKTGIIGFLLFSVIYFFPALFAFYQYKKIGFKHFQILAICHCSLMVTALSNPYILSGSIGLFFPSLIFSYYLYVYKTKHTHDSELVDDNA